MFNIQQQANNYLQSKKVKVTLLLMLSAVFVLSSHSSFSQTSGGGFVGDFMQRNIGARPVAMGGAYTAIVNEPNAVFYNPAGLGFFEDQPTFSSTFATLGYGRTNSSVSWGQEVYDNLGVGVGFNTVTSAKFMGRDIRGNELGEMYNFQYALAASGAYRIESTSMGITLKYLADDLMGTAIGASGYAIDIGSKFNVMDLFSFGIAVHNVSGMMFWNNADEDVEALPYSVRAGIAMEYGLNDEVYQTRSTVTGEMETVYVPASRYILVGLDAVLTQNRVSPDLILGVEAVPHEIIAFRGGISLYGDKLGVPQLFPMTNWGGGISIRPPEETIQLPFLMNFDYTISGEHIANNGISHHISILFLF